MKKSLLILIVLIVLLATGCATYVTPGRYNESTPYTNDYEILGPVSVDILVKQPFKGARGLKELAMEAALAEYPDADDLIDVTITEKKKLTFLFITYIYEWEVTLEGNAIQYN